MTDEKNTDTTSTDDAKDSQDIDEKDESQDTDAETEDKETKSGEEKEEKKEEKEEEDVNLDDFTPETRIEEEKKKDEKEDEDLDPDDEETISKVVDKKLSPLQTQIQKQNNEIEANSYIVDNPEFAKYKPVILKYMTHSSYKNIPVKNIAAIVAANDMQKIGASKEREATKKAADTKSKGTQARKAKGGKTDWLTASKEEYEKKLAQVKGMRR